MGFELQAASSGSIDGSLIGYLLQSRGLLYVSFLILAIVVEIPRHNKVTWLLIAVIPVFIPHVWRATFVKEESAEKYESMISET